MDAAKCISAADPDYFRILRDLTKYEVTVVSETILQLVFLLLFSVHCRNLF